MGPDWGRIMSREAQGILFLSVAVESAEFDTYDLRRLTTCEKTDLPFWLSVQDLSSNSMTYVNACDGGRFPEPTDFAGVVVGGSMYSAYEERPWQRSLETYLQRAATSGIPLLGVCGGHQLLVDALGGRVEANRHGRYIGAFPLRLTTTGLIDPLFAGIEQDELVQFAHRDVAVSLPPNAAALATVEHDANAAIRYSPTVVSTQFHLELSPSSIDQLIQFYREDAETITTIGAQVDTVSTQQRIFANWLRSLTA